MGYSHRVCREGDRHFQGPKLLAKKRGMAANSRDVGIARRAARRAGCDASNAVRSTGTVTSRRQLFDKRFGPLPSGRLTLHLAARRHRHRKCRRQEPVASGRLGFQDRHSKLQQALYFAPEFCMVQYLFSVQHSKNQPFPLNF